MSIVGTRPPTLDEWNKYELHHRARLSIKPGMFLEEGKRQERENTLREKKRADAAVEEIEKLREQLEELQNFSTQKEKKTVTTNR